MIESLDQRKAAGPDEISGCILQECKQELGDRIQDIVQCSTKEGKVAMDWKSANIVPIHKGGKKEEPLNYRAVSLRNTVVKRCEKLIKRRWTKH